MREAYEEHKQIKTLLGEIARITAADESYDMKIKVLKEDVEHHVKDEEGEMFPDAKKFLGERRLVELGAELEKRKQQLEAVSGPPLSQLLAIQQGLTSHPNDNRRLINNGLWNRMAIGSSGIGPRYLVHSQSGTLRTKRRIIVNEAFASVLVLSATLVGLATVTMAQDSKPVAPDNSAVNVRDRNPAAMTADQQSNNKADVELTRQIRRAVMKDDSLSMMAHNVKIVSANGDVTLRGPVKTEQEKTVIASKAQAIAGADKVDNQLEVKGQ